MEETLAQKAKRLLSSVPEDQWITGDFTDGKGACCAIGHFERLTSSNPEDYSRSNCGERGFSNLRMVTAKFIRDRHEKHGSIATVNNSPQVNGYTEPVIKDRVIHLLDDMIEAGL